ncbi:MAG: peptidoglycan-binding protein [Micavibrio sp.]
MKIELSQPFAANGKVDEFDVKQMKKALNRIGYYQPYEKVGITGIADMGVFDALKAFQKDRGLTANGSAKPDDETIHTLNKETSKTPKGQYIWRTVEDDKVRKGHAEFNRTIRDWSDDPDPGEEFNCRCWAEPVSAVAGLKQEIIELAKDSNKPWTNMDFVSHFYFGGGQGKTLTEIGFLNAVIDHAKKTMFENVLQQVAEKAKNTQEGVFTGSWSNSYPFGDVIFSLGGVTIKGRFGGTVKKEDNILIIDAQAEYEFSDTFTDPLNKRQKKIGSSALEDIPYDFSKLWWNPGNLGAAYFAADTEYMGTPYEITGHWKTKITGSISAGK